ncbi:hypothetical protein PF005_g27753 [Phytophthora fragariae]|uniref:Uncharacterized protein n=1 Tax=Phytophthora fragariae TaxID=53985 RepID=A0A6A3Q723_9STRA|nr:hypothetical protein PF007_g27109 [Phytophthora fragariae]KAE9169955.1 hypothetical protein PF005_g27753 [Phytophthora fragariae]
MSVDKVRKTAIVRKHVRESRRSTKRTASTTTSALKRLIRPDERPSVRDYRFEQPTEESDDESDDDASDAAFEFWREVLRDLTDDDDDQATPDRVVRTGNAGHEGRIPQGDSGGVRGGVQDANDARHNVDPEDQVRDEHGYDTLQGSIGENGGQDGEVEDAEREKRKQFEKKVRKIARFAKEEIPPANQEPFPANSHLVTSFPQEKIIPDGLRGLKVTLAELSTQANESSTESVPAWHFLSPQRLRRGR